MTKHTPGPWYWAEDHPKNACISIYKKSKGKREIATLYDAPGDNAKISPEGVWGDHSERRANARLIVAAPKMIKALRMVAASPMRNAVYDVCVAILAEIDGATP